MMTLRRVFVQTMLGVGVLASVPGLAGAAHADTNLEGLQPDRPAYCIMNKPFALAQAVNDFKVHYWGVLGSPGQNNWQCDYRVVATIPGTDGNSGPIPVPIPYRVPVDHRNLCDWLYPGATTEWSTIRDDWTCLPKQGRSYGSQQPDGTHEYWDE